MAIKEQAELGRVKKSLDALTMFLRVVSDFGWSAVLAALFIFSVGGTVYTAFEYGLPRLDKMIEHNFSITEQFVTQSKNINNEMKLMNENLNALIDAVLQGENGDFDTQYIMQANKFIIDILSKMLNKHDAERVQLLRVHNGTHGSRNELPFQFFSCTHEVTNKYVAGVKKNLQRIYSADLNELITSCYDIGRWTAEINDVVDKGTRRFFQNQNVLFATVIPVWGGRQQLSGLLIIQWGRRPLNGLTIPAMLGKMDAHDISIFLDISKKGEL